MYVTYSCLPFRMRNPSGKRLRDMASADVLFSMIDLRIVSALHAAQHHAGDEVLLQERVDH